MNPAPFVPKPLDTMCMECDTCGRLFLYREKVAVSTLDIMDEDGIRSHWGSPCCGSHFEWA